MKLRLSAHVYSPFGSLPRGFFQVAQEKLSYVQTYPEIADLKNALGRSNENVLVLDVGNDEDEVVATLRNFLKDEVYHEWPVILVSEVADAFEGILERYFPVVVPVLSPCTTDELLAAIQYVSRNFSGSEAIEISEQIADPASEIDDEILAEDSEEFGFSEAGEEKLEKPQTLTSFDIRAENLRDGKRIQFEQLERNGITPENRTYLAAAVEVFENASPIVQSRLGRLAFLAKCFGESMGLQDELMDMLKAAGFLYSHGVKGSRPRLFKTNYLRTTKEMKLELSSFLKDSAITAATEFESPRVGNLIAGLARMIGEEDPASVDCDLQALSCLAATDLVERICFSTGFFSSQGAYTLLKESRRGSLDFLDPEVRVTLSKFLAETLERMPRVFTLTREDRENPENIQRKKDYEAYVLGPNEERVPLSSLKPGMRIAIPLSCFDGRPLLDSGILLDEDLIERLWTLAQIRPLVASSLVVFWPEGDSEEEEEESLRHVN